MEFPALPFTIEELSVPFPSMYSSLHRNYIQLMAQVYHESGNLSKRIFKFFVFTKNCKRIYGIKCTFSGTA